MRIFAILFAALLFCAGGLETATANMAWAPQNRQKTLGKGKKALRAQVYLTPYYWRAAPDAAGTYSVVIDRSEQAAWVFLDGEKIGQTAVSTGREGFETPEGEFKIMTKHRHYRSNLYGSWVDAEGKFKGEADAGDSAPSGLRYAAADMPYFMRLTNDGVGMHAGFIPGFAASHGCIRLPAETAAKFFEVLPVGTQVTIQD
jgi:lipoprotein-anchoring transpeptidase ErfK/SrfK